MTRIKVNPLLVISIILVGALSSIYEINKPQFESVDMNEPNPNPKIWPKSPPQQGTKDCVDNENSSFTYYEYKEVKVYMQGRWTTVDKVRLPQKQQEPIDWDMIYDEFEGR